MSTRRISKDYAYLELKRMIVEGKLLPDQELVEGQLADLLELSKTPLREALQRLEVEELVLRQPNGRLRTASITLKEAEELFIVRSYLEGIVTKQATIEQSPADIEELEEYCQRIEKYAKYEDYEEVFLYGQRFHEKIYAMSNNYIAVKLLNQMNAHITRYRRFIPATDQNIAFQQSAFEHALILEAMINDDPELAEQLMRKHIMDSLKSAENSIRKIELKLNSM